ncbi:N-6 DNA methylase [Ignavibacterium sp.]|uniref:Eco57I restriction-modification methylase domain-containing protein n=1 Tax=Ignavibacterium sp. TaxID=2651167 RepID=UPI0022069CF9|nr:N-6 DNA methylase [Ignavibacterium sp.]BDQ02294.1 MAG: type II restriction endonuclease [Ignavibacterium sp.]
MNFQNPYSRSDYKNFFRNQFLTDDFKITEERLSFEFTPQYSKEAFLIGEDKSLELKVIEVQHESENDPRVGLSRDIFRLMRSYGYRRALVLLHSSKSQNYRLSLATIEFSLEGSKVKKEYSNPRRYSFFLGPDAKVKTPYEFLVTKGRVKDFEDLQGRFSIEVVTKQFYQEIANWYFWAVKNVRFPKDAENETNGRNIAVIRLITRLIFIWFMKAKGLIGNHLFNPDNLKEYLINFDPSSEDSNFYKAILQNLFFATLNTKIEKRKFRREETFQGKNKDYMEPNYYRYHSLFKNPKDMLDIFKNIPFLNGGLFECLDKSKDDPTNETGKEIRIDGFSDKAANQPAVPNFLFFSGEQKVDLQKDFGSAKYKNTRVKGLINILETYNFTIDENTPIDEEVALDPELLGKVFENLLAAYNPETATTVRKATGSYYTPREIVNYMVDESLIAYLKNKMIEGAKSYIEIGTDQIDMFGNKARKGQLKIEEELLPSRWIDKEDELEVELRKLISYAEEPHRFTDKETDILIDAINSCKILDPAVGSGAFPMGVLHKLVLILSKLDPHNIKWKQQQINAIENNITDPGLKKILINKIEDNFKRNELDYGRKLYLIQNCLYGVDIQPIAIQIAKLRFFISLLVDEKVISPEGEVDNLGIDPLPNLETKLVAANTLIGLPDTLTLRPSELDNLEKELFELRQKYFTTSEESEKKKLENKDRELRKKIRKVLDDNRIDNEFSDKIASWDPYDTNKFSEWFDPEWMFGVKVNESSGFDIVIGNPPYIQLQKAISDKSKFKYADLYKDQNYKTFERTGDIYCLFYEKGINLLRKFGHLCYITSNKWMRAGYGETLREFFTKHNPKVLIDLGPGIFESATVDTNILLIQKSNPKVNGHSETNLSGEKSIFNLQALTLTKENNIDFNKQLKEKGVTLTKLTKDAWFIGNNAEQKLKEKIELIGKPLKDWDVKIYYGIKTGLNEAFIITTEKRNEILNNCSVAESSRFGGLTERQRTEAIIKPILRGRDIKRYYYDWAGLWVIGTFPALHLNIEKFPALKKYFLDNFDIRQLEQSGKKYPNLGFNARKQTGNKWFETQDQIAYYPEFEKEKVVWQRITQEPTFCIVEPNVFILDSMAFFTGNNLKYIMGILNSKLIYEYVLMIVHQYGFTGFRLSNQYVEVMPLPPITPNNHFIIQQIETLVDKIITAKKQNPQSDTSAWEKEIDNLVYQLYELTPEEIEIIEGGK